MGRGYLGIRFATVVLGACLLGCGGAATEVKEGGDSGADPAKAQSFVDKANAKLKEGEFAAARDLLAEANRYSDAQVRHQIKLSHEEVDKGEAKAVGGEVGELSGSGKCEEAITKTADTIRSRNETSVPKRLTLLTLEGNVGCIDKLMDDGDLKRARALAAHADSDVALDKASLKKLRKKLRATILATLEERTNAASTQRDWPAASKVIAEAVAKGEAGPSERDEALKPVRAGIESDIGDLVSLAKDEPKGAPKALVRVDELLAAGFWRTREDEPENEAGNASDAEAERLRKLLANSNKGDGNGTASANGGDKPSEQIPANLAKLRRELAFTVACAQLKCSAATPRAMWLYGHNAMQPPFAPEAASSRTLRHGQRVWSIAKAGTWVLVSRRDPGELGSLAARAHVAYGWVKSNALKPSDTRTWLPPGNAIIGTRVWGPLRPGEKTYELGMVTGIVKNNVQVQRLSDQAIAILPRAKVHFGIVDPGTKVLAFCEPTKQQPALIKKVKESKHASLGDSRATVSCLDGNTEGKQHEDALGALRIKPTWLPRRR